MLTADTTWKGRRQRQRGYLPRPQDMCANINYYREKQTETLPYLEGGKMRKEGEGGGGEGEGLAEFNGGR